MLNFFKNKAPDLEAKIAELEQRVTTLEIQVKKYENAKKQSQKSSGNSSAKEGHILSIMNKTGLSREEVIIQVDEAAKRLGISYRDYDHYNFHLIPVERQREKYVTFMEKKDRRATKKKNAERKKQKYIPVVMAATGWDYNTVEAKMERAKEVTGASYEHYAIFRFWELTEEEQKTYFTKRDANNLRKKYNTDPEIVKTLMNKDLCCAKLEAYLGRPWMSTENMTYEKFREKFANEKKIVYKPRASSGGHGIQLIEMTPDTMEDVFARIRALPVGIIEGYLVQHPEMKKLSLNSVNTIRVVTIRTNRYFPGIEKNKVHFLYAGVRMGQGNSHVDNLHSGGLMAAVNVETGIVETGGVDHTNKVYEIHPDTNAVIKGFQLPLFDEVKKLIERASADLPGYFGWDIAVTENGPVIVEVNTSPGADGLQTPYVPQKKGMRYVIEKYL